MPSSNDSRAIKITASTANNKGKKIDKSSPILFVTAGLGLLLGILFLGCEFGFLPAGMCGNNNLDSNVPPLTPMPTETPLHIAAQPAQLPVCENIELTKPPICGGSYIVGDNSYCGEDGTAFRQFTYRVSGSVAEKIQENLSKGIPLESDPAGLCHWTSLTPTDLNVYDGAQQYYDASFTCAGPSETFIKITDSLGPESCEVSANSCPDGYELETSTLEADHMLYCVPEGQTNKSASCGSGMFVDEQNSCCSPKPANSLAFLCIDYQPTQNGFSCSPDYTNMEKLKMGITLPACSKPDRPRPTEEKNTNDGSSATCTPDPTGGGCP